MSYEKITVPGIGEITKICPIIDDGKHQLLDIFEDEQGNLYLFSYIYTGDHGDEYVIFVAPIDGADIISFLCNHISEGELWLKTEGSVYICEQTLIEDTHSWKEEWIIKDKDSWWDENKCYFLSGIAETANQFIYLDPDDGEFDDEVNFFVERQAKKFKGITLDDYLDMRTKKDKKKVLYYRDNGKIYRDFYKFVKDDSEAYGEITNYIESKFKAPELENLKIEVESNNNGKFVTVYSEIMSFDIVEESSFPVFGQVGKGE